MFAELQPPEIKMVEERKDEEIKSSNKWGKGEIKEQKNVFYWPENATLLEI